MNPEKLISAVLAIFARDQEDLDDILACNPPHAAQSVALNMCARHDSARAELAELRHRLACGRED
jgi:tRNA1(Val) A37 N6-methylase TrmN6